MGISNENVLRKLVQQMNKEAPARRLSVAELQKMDDPHYTDKDGHKYSISKQELALVKEGLRWHQVGDVRLPILLFAESSHERSTWRVEGKAECAVICYVLGRGLPEDRDKMFLYAPHVSSVRKKLPTATALMYLP